MRLPETFLWSRVYQGSRKQTKRTRKAKNEPHDKISPQPSFGIDTVSNDKSAYGWSGHVLWRQSCCEGGDMAELARNNIIAVPDDIYDRIDADMGNCELPEPVEAHKLGRTDGWEEPENSLAVGVGFTEAYLYYAAPFEEAELRAEGAPLVSDLDAQYLAAMQTTYGLTLPPCRLMVGLSFERPYDATPDELAAAYRQINDLRGQLALAKSRGFAL